CSHQSIPKVHSTPFSQNMSRNRFFSPNSLFATKKFDFGVKACYQKISLFLAVGLWISIILAKFAPLDIYSHH
ncbi:MAG: hypothetical protein PUD41_01920, partial [bacterium]|nr:hypothetical protein [bacterium]